METISDKPLDTQLQTVDESIAQLQGCIAIIVDRDTASMAMSVVGYAHIKNNIQRLCEWLCRNAYISAFHVTLLTTNSSVFTSEPGSGLNALISNIANFGKTVRLVRTNSALVPIDRYLRL